MIEISKPSFLKRDVKVWIRRLDGTSKLLRIAPRFASEGNQRYELFNAFEPHIEYLGCVLFDAKLNWIYDGDRLYIDEQELLMFFIISHRDFSGNQFIFIG